MLTRARLTKTLLERCQSLRETHHRRNEGLTSPRSKARVILLLVLILWDEWAEVVNMRSVFGPNAVLERTDLIVNRKLPGNTPLWRCVGLRGPCDRKTFPCLLWRRDTLHNFHTQGLDKPSKEVDVSQEYLDKRSEKLWAYQ